MREYCLYRMSLQSVLGPKYIEAQNILPSRITMKHHFLYHWLAHALLVLPT